MMTRPPPTVFHRSLIHTLTCRYALQYPDFPGYSPSGHTHHRCMPEWRVTMTATRWNPHQGRYATPGSELTMVAGGIVYTRPGCAGRAAARQGTGPSTHGSLQASIAA